MVDRDAASVAVARLYATAALPDEAGRGAAGLIDNTEGAVPFAVAEASKSSGFCEKPGMSLGAAAVEAGRFGECMPHAELGSIGAIPGTV